jgi:methionyl-tRNA formyltransferase
MGPVRTLFFGSGTFALPVLERLASPDADLSARVRLVAVVTAAPRPAGRSAELRPTPVATAATARHIPAVAPASLRTSEVLDELRALRPDLIVLADYGRLIPADVLDLPRFGALNLHPSLLPRHRGAAPVPAAIAAGDATTGVSLMRMDEGLDSGPLLAQREVALDGTETAPDLEARLADLAADLLAASLPAWLEGRLEAQPQATTGVSLTRPLRRADGRLDAGRPARALERQVRALQPWPGSFLEGDGERLIVWRAGVEAGPASAAPGALVACGETLALQTVDGLLRLDEVQPAGRRRMSGAEYRRGRRH